MTPEVYVAILTCYYTEESLKMKLHKTTDSPGLMTSYCKSLKINK